MTVERLTPPQRRVIRELFAIERPRPRVDPSLLHGVQRSVTDGTAAAAALRPPGARSLRLAKSALSALSCEGRYLDQLEGTFTPSPRLVTGTLAHRAVELDQAGERREPAALLARHAWAELAERPGWEGAYLAGLEGLDADAIRARVVDTVTEFRATFPPLPAAWTVRMEPALRVRLHGGAIELRGRPDMLLGRLDPSVRRMLLIDLKTGQRSEHHAADMRFYALLATLKYGVAPFRVATYYLDEADWEHEDVDDALLHQAAELLVERAATAARLTWDRPDDADLTLDAGPACGWCSRAPACPARLARDGERLLRVA